MITKKAWIEWIPKEAGGRNRPPLGTDNPPYSPVVRFVDEPWPHPMGAWSLAVVKDERQSTETRWIADVRFRVDEAPQEALRDGREFELYEGRKCVARGEILGGSAHEDAIGNPGRVSWNPVQS